MLQLNHHTFIAELYAYISYKDNKILLTTGYRLAFLYNEDVGGPLSTSIDNTGRSPVLTGELVPVDWHGLPVQVLNGPDRSSKVLIIDQTSFV